MKHRAYRIVPLGKTRDSLRRTPKTRGLTSAAVKDTLTASRTSLTAASVSSRVLVFLLATLAVAYAGEAGVRVFAGRSRTG